MTIDEFQNIVNHGDKCNLIRIFENNLGDEIISEMVYCGRYEDLNILNFKSVNNTFHILIPVNAITDACFNKVENRKCVIFKD